MTTLYNEWKLAIRKYRDCPGLDTEAKMLAEARWAKVIREKVDTEATDAEAHVKAYEDYMHLWGKMYLALNDWGRTYVI